MGLAGRCPPGSTCAGSTSTSTPTRSRGARAITSSPSPTRRIRAANLRAALAGLAALGLIEAGLQVAGVGPASRLFALRHGADGRAQYEVNRDAAHRFFPPGLRRRPPSGTAFPARKPPDGVRIFALGESTLVGFPNPPGTGFPSFLELLLADAFPERRFEVVNCGITAVNSFCLLDFAEEVAGYEPDLLILYAGHNEFIGPYGPTTPFVRLGNDRRAIRAHMLLQRSKLYYGLKQLVFAASGLLGGGEPTQAFGPQLAREEIGILDPAYGRAVDNYRANLEAIAATAGARGVPLVLGTLVSNVKDFPPLRSACGAQPGAVEALVEELEAEAEAGGQVGARARCEAALRDSPYCAALHFELGRLWLRAGRAREAAVPLGRARDLDRLPFRAPGAFNDIIRQVGAGHDHVAVSDLETAFAAASPAGLIGDELIAEYLHPTLYGHYLMARSLAADLVSSPLARAWGLAQPSAMADFETCRARLGVTALQEALARNDLILFLRNMPYAAPPARLRQRVADLIGAQLSAYRRLSAQERDSFRRRGGLAFLEQAATFAPGGMRQELAERLRALAGEG